MAMHGQRFLIAGLGFMGGALAKALCQRGATVLLWHHREGTAAAAAAAGLGTALTTPSEQPWDLAVACAPVPALPGLIHELTTAGPLVTDVGSVKGTLAEHLAEHIKLGRYVPSHPMCGSHLTGWQAGDPGIWAGAPTVVCPGPHLAATARVTTFWRDLDCRVLHLDAHSHDQAVAKASHIPHVCAALAAAGLDDRSALLASTGFRDTTRVAGAGAALWAGILSENRQAMRIELAALRHRLDLLTNALDTDDQAELIKWLAAGNAGRQRFDNRTL